MWPLVQSLIAAEWRVVKPGLQSDSSLAYTPSCLSGTGCLFKPEITQLDSEGIQQVLDKWSISMHRPHGDL